MFRICGRLPTAENNRCPTAESSFLYSFVFVFGPSHSRSQAERYLWNRVACSDTKKICVCLWFILFYVSTQCFHACWHVYLIHISHAHSAWLKTSSKPRSVKRECSSHFLSAGVCIGFQGSLKGESYLTPPTPPAPRTPAPVGSARTADRPLAEAAAVAGEGGPGQNDPLPLRPQPSPPGLLPPRPLPSRPPIPPFRPWTPSTSPPPCASVSSPFRHHPGGWPQR